MDRTYSRQDLMTFARMYGRRVLSRMVQQQTAFGGAREYYDTLGYPTEIGVEQYAQRYARQDIAGRVVDLPAQDTWRKPPSVSEDGDTDTEFVDAWESLLDKRIWSKLSRVDKLSGIGSFGVLLLGFADGEEELEQPVNINALEGPQDLLYLRPLPEGDISGQRIRIAEFDDNSQSERYGLPEMYEIKFKHEDDDFQKVHWTRVLHLAEGKQDDDVYGTPRLERVFNRLDDIIKLVGGGAEATWLNMRPGTLLSPREGFEMDMDSSEIEDEIENYAHDPLRFLMLRGVEAEQIGASEVVDVTGPFDVALSLIAAASGIPQRVLIGSAQGELAAAEWDAKQWAGEVHYRQTNYAEGEILRPFIDRLIEYGILPASRDGYDVEWPPLIEMTDAEEAEIANQRAQAVRQLSDPMAAYPIDEEEKRDILNLPAQGEMVGNIAVNEIDSYIPTMKDEAIDAELRAYGGKLSDLIESAQDGDMEQEVFERRLSEVVAASAFAIYLAASGKRATDLTEDDLEAIRQFEQGNLGAISDLSEDVYEEQRFLDEEGNVKEEALVARVNLWNITAMGLANVGVVMADLTRNYRFELGGTIEHCEDCLRLDGQVHSGLEWRTSGLMPQSHNLECGGWNCDCRLVPTRAAKRGAF